MYVSPRPRYSPALRLTWPYPTLCMSSPHPRYSPVPRLTWPYPTLCMDPPAPGTVLCSVYLSLTLHCVCIPPPQVLACAPSNVDLSLTLHYVFPPSQVLACAPSNVALPYTVYVFPRPRYSPVLHLTWPYPTLCMYPPVPGTRLCSV